MTAISKKQICTMGTYSMLTLSIWVVLLYLNTFATEVLLIPAATLATALLVAKVLDFVVSLFSGMIIEKVKISKKGKNQSWLYVGRWLLAITVCLEVCNTSSAPLVVRVAILSVVYTLLNCLMNMIQTAYYALVGVVAGPNMEARNAMTVSFTRQLTIVTVVCSLIPTLVTELPFGSWNYFVVALVFTLPMPYALGKIADQAEGKDVPVGGASETHQISITDMVGTLTKNPQLLILFVSNIFLYIGTYMYQAIYSYYFIYVVGNFNLLTVATLIYSVIGILAALVMPKFCAKLGKRNSCIFGFALYGLCLIGVNFLGTGGWIVYTIFMVIGAFGRYAYTPYLIVMFLDCGEYYLWKTGKDTRSVAAGLAAPPIKLGMAIGSSLGLYLLSATGYVAGFTPTATWVKSYMSATFLIPGIILLVAAAILFAYKISDDEATKYATENTNNA